MIRTYGRCARGQRLVADAPFGKWWTLTFLAALRCDRLTAPCVIDGPINGESFRAYVEQVLVPVLAQGNIVVMDNLGSHNSRSTPAHPRRRSQALLLARQLVRPQSDRAGLRQNEDPAAQGRRPDNRRHLASHQCAARLFHANRMRKLSQKAGYASAQKDRALINGEAANSDRQHYNYGNCDPLRSSAIL